MLPFGSFIRYIIYALIGPTDKGVCGLVKILQSQCIGSNKMGFLHIKLIVSSGIIHIVLYSFL